METKKYVILIKETSYETVIEGRDWVSGAGDKEPTEHERNYGYSPEIKKQKLITKTVFEQTVAEFDMKKVIKAVNNIE